MKVIFGSRGSDLALTQTGTVINAFKNAHPGVEVELRVIRTTGDDKPDARLEEIGGLGAFTREIEMALLNSDIDVAVHSLKDLPTAQPEGLRVAAVVARQSPADALISNRGYTLDALPKGAVVGTSSLRRKAQLLAVRGDLRIRELRGNVPTRMQRVREGHLDAALLAMAGLIRLRLDQEPGVRELPLGCMLPAPGQGALALEVLEGNVPLSTLLASLHDEASALAVNSERAALQAFGGGCRAPLGVYASPCDKENLSIQSFAADVNTGRVVRISRITPMTEAISTGHTVGKELREELQKHALTGEIGQTSASNDDVDVSLAPPMQSASGRA